MKKMLSIFLALAAVLVIGSTSAMAEEGMFGPIKLGVQGTFADDTDFGVGARVEYSLQEMISLPIDVVAFFNWYFPDGFDFWEISGNATYSIPMDMIVPYAGAGLYYASFDAGSFDDSEIGLNILGGAKFELGMGMTPFAEFRLTMGDYDQWMISGGVLF
ncbi:MAG: outer membrane beta-barrel protein [Acidobacteria bacterium]|nr:outer membrane beta-barrel protein [Acidobacteriota bacterium]